MTITYMAGSFWRGSPDFVVGPVIEEATEVEIRFANGANLRVPTFTAPAPLDHVRFFAVQRAPGAILKKPPQSLHTFKWFAGRNEDGHVVACLVPSTSVDGTSQLSNCM